MNLMVIDVLYTKFGQADEGFFRFFFFPFYIFHHFQQSLTAASGFHILLISFLLL